MWNGESHISKMNLPFWGGPIVVEAAHIICWICWLLLTKSDDCRCIKMCFWSAIVGLLIAIWSKWEWQALSMMRSSLAESSEWRCISMGLERTAAKNCHQAYITIPFVWTWRKLTSYVCLKSKWGHLVKSNCKNSS